MTITTTTPSNEVQRRDALAERMFTGLLESMELLSVHLGVELGLYASLHTDGPATAAELSDRAGIHPRYALEWLEQQAAAGVLDVADRHVEPDRRRFTLPGGHAEALLDPDSPAAVAAAARPLIGIVTVLDAVATAFRSGGGVPYADFGSDMRHGIAAMNRPGFVSGIGDWLAAAPGVERRLRSRPAPRVLDVGCGAGWSSIALARAVPHARVHGIDLDPASVADAARNAEAAGVGDRVTFEVRDAVDAEPDGEGYELVCVFEALHDMAHPVQSLAALRTVLADGGTVLIGDERVSDTFTAPADFNDRFMYAFSVTHCLPATMAENPTIATGTVLRPDTLRDYATRAGFATVQELSVEHDFWRFYHLDGR